MRGLGIRVYGLGFRVYGLWFMVQGLWMDQGLGLTKGIGVKERQRKTFVEKENMMSMFEEIEKKAFVVQEEYKKTIE